MGRLNGLITQSQVASQEAIEAEVEDLSFRPDNIDAETWAIILENGRLATERLNEILRSPSWVRLKAADKAKLIQLAQNRAYGLPAQNKNGDGSKRKAGIGDVTAAELRDLASRAALPEYRNTKVSLDVEDAEEI
jgi:hypothetical protein